MDSLLIYLYKKVTLEQIAISAMRAGHKVSFAPSTKVERLNVEYIHPLTNEPETWQIWEVDINQSLNLWGDEELAAIKRLNPKSIFAMNYYKNAPEKLIPFLEHLLNQFEGRILDGYKSRTLALGDLDKIFTNQ